MAGVDDLQRSDGGSTWQVGTTFSDLAADTYQTRAKDGNGCLSADVTVTITQPAAAVGGTIAKVINLTGSTGYIQWQKSASASGPWSDIGGATSASLDVSSYYATTPYFRAKVTSGAGCTPEYSSVAKVTDTEFSGTTFLFR